MTALDENLVSTEWLEQGLGSPDIAILDASWHLPAAKRDAKAEFLEARIPGARFFDIDDIADTASPLPHMLPSPEKFASRMQKMGVGDGIRVIAYDSAGLFSAARVWWMFKVFGHDAVAVLDGGLPKWKRENRPLENGQPTPPIERHFSAGYRPELVRDMASVTVATMNGTAQIADARSPGRFRGEEPEARAGVRPGHIPGARNVHYASLFTPDGTLRPAHDIVTVFANAGIDLDKPVITSCGSGVTAAILSLALTRAGARDLALYDGSWAEWGSAPGKPVATGP